MQGGVNFMGFFDDMRNIGGGKNSLYVEKDNGLFAGKDDIIVRKGGPFGEVVFKGTKTNGTIKLNNGTKIKL